MALTKLMDLSEEETSDLLLQGDMDLTLTGMSGMGKSKWTKELILPGVFKSEQALGIEIDTEIGNNPLTSAFVEGIEGKDMVERMGKAFGTPWENPWEYEEKETAYLEAEKQETHRAYQRMLNREGQPIICDTTGSVIYCPDEMKLLSAQSAVIYLEAHPSKYAQMLENFMADPKPVCWGILMEEWKELVDTYGSDEAFKQLPRLYQELLISRQKLYESFADITVPWIVHRNIEGGAVFLQKVGTYMRKKIESMQRLVP